MEFWGVMHQRCVSRDDAGTLLDEDFSQVIRNELDQEGKEGRYCGYYCIDWREESASGQFHERVGSSVNETDGLE